VLTPKKGKPTAVIGGQVVPLGGFVGEARLVRLSETEAVLEGPEGIERLYLTPDVEKKMNVTKGASRRKKE
jgi:MSHA biogenesis protein MshK